MRMYMRMMFRFQYFLYPQKTYEINEIKLCMKVSAITAEFELK